MTHLDPVQERFDELQARRSGMQISEWSARIMCQDHKPMANGSEISETYGLLYHWTTRKHVAKIRERGLSPYGTSEPLGFFLTPSWYSPCLAPYRLGLPTPRDVCIGVNVEKVREIWGPAIAPAMVPIWDGGGLEFYCTEAVPRDQIKIVQEYDICGDPQWSKLMS